DGLHRTIAKRARSDQRRALVVMECAGHDFGSRSRSAVDQDHKRLALDEIAAARSEALGLFRVTAAGRDDLAAGQKRTHHRNRLVEQAARIVAEIDDVADDLVLRNLLL